MTITTSSTISFLHAAVIPIVFILSSCVTATSSNTTDYVVPIDSLVSGVPPTTSFCKTGNDGYACAEPILLPEGFAVSRNQDPAILKVAVHPSGGGNLCCAVVAEATADVTIYRAWAPQHDSSVPKPLNYYPTYQFGSWWSPTAPPQSRAQYRHDDDVCAAWNSLTVYTKCMIKPGAQVAIGRGQSAKCGDNLYLPESPVLQIFFPKGSGSKESTTQCTTYHWPGTP